jgi:hypothetical protein
MNNPSIHPSHLTTTTRHQTKTNTNNNQQPGYILFNAGVILWLLAAATIMTFMGFRRPQAGDERLRALPYRVIIFAAAGPIALAGVLLCTAATLVTNSQEDERRMWAGEVAFSQSGDRWWLMYTVRFSDLIFFFFWVVVVRAALTACGRLGASLALSLQSLLPHPCHSWSSTTPSR